MNEKWLCTTTTTDGSFCIVKNMRCIWLAILFWGGLKCPKCRALVNVPNQKLTWLHGAQDGSICKPTWMKCEKSIIWYNILSLSFYLSSFHLMQCRVAGLSWCMRNQGRQYHDIKWNTVHCCYCRCCCCCVWCLSYTGPKWKGELTFIQHHHCHDQGTKRRHITSYMIMNW